MLLANLSCFHAGDVGGRRLTRLRGWELGPGNGDPPKCCKQMSFRLWKRAIRQAGPEKRIGNDLGRVRAPENHCPDPMIWAYDVDG
jgi:hypothetical protein